MTWKTAAILSYGKSHTIADTARLAARLLGLDTPKDDHGHFYKEEGAPCPHELTQAQQQRVKEIVAALSVKHPKINRAKQRQHETARDAAEATRRDRAAHPGVFSWAKSYFTISMQSAHAMVLDRIRKGDYSVGKNLLDEVYLIVDLKKDAGMWLNRQDKKVKTSKVRVDFSSRDGYHIYPVGGDSK